MHLDISRDTFEPNQKDPKKQQLQIFHEQGRVLIDAAMNHQIASMLHEMRVLATDMHGPHWGPTSSGFAIEGITDSDFKISPGNYYVNGYRCAAVGADNTYTAQPFLPLLPQPKTDSKLTAPYLVYLDVWERLLTDISYPSLRDPALEQLDAPSASQIVWQVRVLSDDTITNAADTIARRESAAAVINSKNSSGLDMTRRGRLSARPVDGSGVASQKSDDRCEEEIDERYRGLENQLYRIEIHSTGAAFQRTVAGDTPIATFKWSRDNGANIFPITTWSINDTTATVTLAHNGRDNRSTLKAGDYVEYEDEITILRADLFAMQEIPLPRRLFRVQSVNQYDPTLITLYGGDFELPKAPEKFSFEERKAFLRRWDHQSKQTLPKDPERILDSTTPILATDNALLVVAGEENSVWIEIENGIQIHFSKEGEYVRGDYWLIPARYANGKILWPIDETNSDSMVLPKEQSPRTIQHHYAPLAVVFKETTDVGKLKTTDCRNPLLPNRNSEIEFKATARQIEAGEVVVINVNGLIGIARDTIPQDQFGVLLLDGDFDVPKVNSQIQLGAQLFLNADNLATPTQGPDLRKFGFCIRAAAPTDQKVRIRLSQ